MPPRLERPAVDRRYRQARRRDAASRRRIRRHGSVGRRGIRHDDLARLQHRELVGQRLEAVGPAYLGGRELAGREVEQRARPWCRSVGPCRRDRGQRQHERRLTGIEIVRVGQRPGRDDAHDLAFDDPLGLARILDLIADRDAKALLDEPRDITVHGVERHAAHGNAAAVGVLRSGRQRQLERARGDEGVLVEHLVEVAHAEEHDGIAMLLLRVEILTHCGRRGG